MENSPDRIATIINYCTNDYRFLDLCVGEAKKFSSQLIVPVANHFFNGEAENRQILERSYDEHPECLFVEYQFDPQKPYGPYCPYREGDDQWIKYWHSTSRYVASHFLNEEIEYILFLDVDEIVEAKRWIDFLKSFPYREYNALRFYSYLYFREPTLRSTTYGHNALLVRKKALPSLEALLSPYERKGVFDEILGRKVSYLVGLDDKPLVHHYSWVRTKEELFFKVKSWGHATEKNWTALLEEELSAPSRNKENLYSLSYERVESPFDPFQQKVLPRGKGNKLFVDRASLFEISIKNIL